VTELHRAALETATLAGSLAQVTERQRSLAPQLVDKLRDTGLLRSGVPGQPGGAQATPSDILGSAETDQL
jgi:alkylation response protein AidB-like acyl-CoA dehydrogenase